MKRRIGGMVAATTTLLLLAMGGALALSHTQITVGGTTTPASVPVTGMDDDPLTFITDWGVDGACVNTSTFGHIFPGTDVEIDEVVGQLDVITFAACELFGSLPIGIDVDGGDVDVVVREHPANAGDPVEVTITGVNAHLHSTTPVNPTPSNPWACELRAKGSVNATMYPGDAVDDGYIEIQEGFTIDDITALDGTNTETPAASGMTCSSIATGDLMEVSGSFILDTGGAGAISHQ